MAKGNFPFISFQAGEWGKEALARVRLESYGASAEIMENFWPETTGPMQFRQGFLYKSTPTATHDFVHLIPFVKSTTVKYLLCASDLALRIALDGEIVTRSAVSCTIPGGAFADATDFAYWTSISTSGGTASLDSGRLKLVSNGTSVAGLRQAISTTSIGATHGLEVTIERGPVLISIGSTAGAVDIMARTELRTGSHNLAFVPNDGTFYLDVWSTSRAIRYLSSIQIAAAGDVVLTTPWAEADLRSLRYEQSGDVVFVSSGVARRQRIERRGVSSWSVVDTGETNGPFLDPNTDEAITLTPSVTSGNGTLTASSTLFTAEHVGALFQITHGGQLVDRAVAGGGQFTDPIKVQGTGAARTFTRTITGTWVGRWTVQRSSDGITGWSDTSETATANASATYNDNLDNQTYWYRIGAKTGDYTSGTMNVSLVYTGGSSFGVARITGYTSTVLADIEVVKSFSSITASSEWSEGAWSEAQGFAKGTALFDGRLWDGYRDQFVGSESDGYESYTIGDEADDAVQRAVATGKVNPVQWIASLSRLLIGTQGAEVEVRSSSFDEPITPSANTVRPISTYGSADVQPLTIDTRGYFVEQSGVKLMEMLYSVEKQGYATRSMMRMNKNIGRPGLVQIAVARQPDTRIFLIRSDGVLLMSLSEPDDDVGAGWARTLAGGTNAVFESVAVLPAAAENEVYVMVARTVNGATVRSLEKLAPFYVTDAADAVQSDSALVFTSPGTATLSVPHLIGETVAVLADGAKLPDKTVSVGGTITLPRSDYGKVVVGLRYYGRYKSSKLAFGAEAGTALGQKGKGLSITFLLLESMPVFSFGASFETTGPTAMIAMKDRDIESQYDSGPGLTTGTTECLTMPGRLERDPRVCITAESPHLVRLSGYVLGKQTNEKVQ